jgi:aconitate hydratase
MTDSFSARSTLTVGSDSYAYYRLAAVYAKHPQAAQLPYWTSRPSRRWTHPAADARDRLHAGRVLLQDFTGVPAVVDLAAMRDAMKKLGGDPKKINPLQPVELVIDHSVQVDEFGSPTRLRSTGSSSSSATRSATSSSSGARARLTTSSVVPPDTGIVHQVNLEYLARVV